MTIPARSWSNMFDPGIDDPVTTLTVEATTPGDAEVQLCIDGPDDVCLDRKGVTELIADLQRRFAVIVWAGGSRISRPARSWPNAVSDRHTTRLEIFATTPDDNIIQLAVTDSSQALGVCLDPSQARDLIAEIQARLPVIDPAGESL